MQIGNRNDGNVELYIDQLIWRLIKILIYLYMDRENTISIVISNYYHLQLRCMINHAMELVLSKYDRITNRSPRKEIFGNMG